MDKIRQVDGFTIFYGLYHLLPFKAAAAAGPIIIINISQYRSDAIIVQDVGDPVIVPLPDLYQQFSSSCLLNLRHPALHKARILQD